MLAQTRPWTKSSSSTTRAPTAPAPRRAATGDVLAYVDADCRVPLQWLERVEARFAARDGLVGVTGPYRFYDWDWSGRALIRAYDIVVAPATHAFVHHALGIGAILYGGNFTVRRDALARIGGFDCRIEFHGEHTTVVVPSRHQLRVKQ